MGVEVRPWVTTLGVVVDDTRTIFREINGESQVVTVCPECAQKRTLATLALLEEIRALNRAPIVLAEPPCPSTTTTALPADPLTGS